MPQSVDGRVVDLQHGSIAATIRAIVASEDFWAPVNRRAKVKSPLEFVLSAMRVTGAVPDVRPFLWSSAVSVAPISVARGVQNKVLQAMALGMPVVASSVAQRGLLAEPGRHLHVEDDPAAFARRVAGLLTSPGERLAMGRRARAFVEGHHAWDSSGARLDAMLRAVLGAARSAVRTSA